jgi:hypothetical protein
MKEQEDRNTPPLPPCAAEYIARIVRGLPRRENIRQEVDAELASHFEEALMGGTDPQDREAKARQLIAEFGDADLLGLLCRRTRRGPFAPWVWLPLFVTLGAFNVVLFPISRVWPEIIYVSLLLYLLGLAYFLLQTVGRLALGQRLGALCASLRLALCASLCVPYGVLLLVFEPPDTFAWGLKIPTDMVVADPLPCLPDNRTPTDAFEQAVWEAWTAPPSLDSNIVPSLPSLRVLAADHHPLLLKYLASSSAWRLRLDHGALRAERRWQITKSRDAESFSPPQIWIELDGREHWPPSEPVWMDEGTTPQPVPADRQGRLKSTILVRCAGLLVRVSEHSPGPERRLTKAALRGLETEFKAVLDQGDFDRSLLPADSIRTGAPVLSLRSNSQSGLYRTEFRINPGEPGLVYLKAFEVTHNTPLTHGDLREDSDERVGWSDNPDELFLGSSDITIYEGAPGQPYAARFELWFVPDSGRPERKLLERVFKIEGWLWTWER